MGLGRWREKGGQERVPRREREGRKGGEDRVGSRVKGFLSCGSRSQVFVAIIFISRQPVISSKKDPEHKPTD